MKVEYAVTGRIRAKMQTVSTKVVLSWDSDDPLAVVMSFPEDRKSPVWTLGRDLFSQATMLLPNRWGEGDVVLTRERDFVVVILRPPNSARAEVVLPRHHCRLFLEQTTDITPIGQEGPRIEAALQNLIDDIRRRNA